MITEFQGRDLLATIQDALPEDCNQAVGDLPVTQKVLVAVKMRGEG